MEANNLRVIRDYGFASYLIINKFKYEIKNKSIYIDISEDDFKFYLGHYKRSYAEKDKVLRELLKKVSK